MYSLQSEHRHGCSGVVKGCHGCCSLISGLEGRLCPASSSTVYTSNIQNTHCKNPSHRNAFSRRPSSKNLRILGIIPAVCSSFLSASGYRAPCPQEGVQDPCPFFIFDSFASYPSRSCRIFLSVIPMVSTCSSCHTYPRGHGQRWTWPLRRPYLGCL